MSTIESSTAASAGPTATSTPATATSTTMAHTVTDTAAADTTAAPADAPAADAALSAPPPAAALLPLPGSVLLLGDSLAYDEAPAIVAALQARGLAASSGAGPGGGLLDRSTPGVFAHFVNLFTRRQPDLVIYQISLWDTGTVEEQRIAYQHFADLVTGTGASLVFVTAPVISSDHMIPTIAQLDDVVAAVAASHPEQIRILDIANAWGSEFVADLNADGIPERKPDGVHFCPSGAAFTAEWLATQIAALIGIQPAPAEQWVGSGWEHDSRYPSDMCPTG